MLSLWSTTVQLVANEFRLLASIGAHVLSCLASVPQIVVPVAVSHTYQQAKTRVPSIR